MRKMPPKQAPEKATSNKRKAAAQVPAGRNDRFKDKRAQIQASRVLPAQPAEAALKDGELDLQAFVAAHEFEIRSLEEGMTTAQAASTSRAFQQVPRGLRRRTASHNPKRVPKRLRPRAKREMAEDNTPTVESRKRKPRTTRARIRAEAARRLGILTARKKGRRLKRAEAAGADPGKVAEAKSAPRKPRPKVRRNLLNEPPKPKAKFRKRQLNKTWLPTHIWHAKRARMTSPKEPLWRFAIPLTPNEKVYRPVHRTQGDRGGVVWERSYMSTVGLYGTEAGMQRVLERIGVDEDMLCKEKGAKWRLGSRTWSGLLNRRAQIEARQMCEAQIFWNPLSPEAKAEDDPKKRKRELYIRIHPAAFLEVFQEVLRLAKMETPQLYIEDLRYEIGSIELTGPASTEVLQSVLTPYSTKSRPKTKHAELFQSLKGLTNPSALPAGALLGFTIEDPRLKYPPRRPRLDGDEEEEEVRLLELIAQWPAEADLQPQSIFDRDARHNASRLPSQKVINRRRGRTLPQTHLKPILGDPPIPIVILASRSGSATQTQGTWTLLAPWACILPIWYSVVHCPLSSGGNPRFAGLNETRQVAFERGLPWFPADFPATDAGVEWEREQRDLRKKAWDRRPKSKRVEWASLDLGGGRKGEVGDGLKCDFEFLFSFSEDPEESDCEKQKDDDDMDVDDVVSSPKARASQSDSLKLLRRITAKSFSHFMNAPELPPSIPTNGILTVSLKFLSRGTAGPCARIYRLPTTPLPAPVSSNAEVPASIPPEGHITANGSVLPHDIRAQWLARIPNYRGGLSNPGRKPTKGKLDMNARKQLLAKELTAAPEPFPPPKPNTKDISGHPLVPDAEDLIGFVTTGAHCLSEGCGMAIGSIAVAKVFPDVRRDAEEGRLCVVRDAGENVGWIARWQPV